MKKTIKKNLAAGMYNLLNGANISKMDGKEKIAYVKMLRPFKAVHKEYNDLRDDFLEKLKGGNHEEMVAKARKWNDDNKSVAGDELKELHAYFAKYEADVKEAMKDEDEADVELEFEAMTEEAFAKLAEANEWNAGMIEELMEVVVGQ